MKRSPAARELEALADTLWAERRVVEYLLFKLLTAKLVLAADERRFVAPALEEVERMMQTLRAAEVQRAAALESVARGWGVSSDHLTLRELAEQSPEPMAGVFRDHQEAFAELANEIEETARENRKLASASLSHVRETIDALTGPSAPPTYTATGRHDKATARPVRLDEVL